MNTPKTYSEILQLESIANNDKICWYCGEESYKSDSISFQNIDYSGSNHVVMKKQISGASVSIHICEKCDLEENRKTFWARWGGLIVFVLEFVLAYFIGFNDYKWNAFIFVIICNVLYGWVITLYLGGCLGFVLYLIFDSSRYKRPHIRRLNDHPEVMRLKRKGYY